ncbi:MAG: hypothetical protein HC897_12160 [Thermoanaerobaculia bacterium]|nr:hypothetical protein [Thermoanaerobaculia bacterium]
MQALAAEREIDALALPEVCGRAAQAVAEQFADHPLEIEHRDRQARHTEVKRLCIALAEEEGELVDLPRFGPPFLHILRADGSGHVVRAISTRDRELFAVYTFAENHSKRGFSRAALVRFLLTGERCAAASWVTSPSIGWPESIPRWEINLAAVRPLKEDLVRVARSINRSHHRASPTESRRLLALAITKHGEPEAATDKAEYWAAIAATMAELGGAPCTASAARAVWERQRRAGARRRGAKPTAEE